MNKITIFKDILTTDSPNYISIETALNRIKNGKSKKLVESIRLESDAKKRNLLKKQLPCVCFGGTFKTRKAADLIEYSYFIVLDIDKIENPVEYKKEVIKRQFVYACWISPSGNGLKILVKVNSDNHLEHFMALSKEFDNVDNSGKDICRVCYESYDEEIYINQTSEVYSKTQKDYQKEKPLVETKHTDYAKINIALEMIRNSIDGEKHITLLKASKLMGGYISTGIVDELEAIRLLENEISLRGIDDIKSAKTTIKKGIDYGKNEPIIEYKRDYYKPKNDARIKEDDDDFSFLATKEDTDNYISKKLNGTFKLGDKTGFPSFDEYYRFKDAQLEMILGHDNAGKSIVSWYLAVLDAYFNDKVYLIFAGENNVGGVKCKLVEYYMSKPIDKCNELERRNAVEWVEKHFYLIRNDESYTYLDMLNIGRKMLNKYKINKFIIEPYNVLEKTTNNEHQYDYKAMLEMRLFIRQTGIGILLNVHAATEALRRTYPKEHDYYGYVMPPNKADAEGGGKFPNKADNFLVVHRMADHPSEWMWTQIHVQKIKEYETGGRRTFKDQPFKIKMVCNGCGFVDEYDYNPMVDGRKKEQQQVIDMNKFIEPNKEFLTEANPIVINNLEPF